MGLLDHARSVWRGLPPEVQTNLLRAGEDLLRGFLDDLNNQAQPAGDTRAPRPPRPRTGGAQLARDLQLLELELPFTRTELRKAYQAKALELHPDRNPDPDAGAQMAELNAAHQRLLKRCSS